MILFPVATVAGLVLPTFAADVTRGEGVTLLVGYAVVLPCLA